MRVRNVWVCTLGLALATSIACGGGSSSNTSSEPSSPAATPSGLKVDTATAGDVKGMVTHRRHGAGKNEPIKMNADPVCVKQNTTPQFQETYVVGSDGKSLGNVFVYVKDGLGNYVYDTPTEAAKIDQMNCRYHPHVFGMRVGQPLEILNSDPTLHNIHALPKGNKEFNTGQPIQGMKTTHTFDGERSHGAVQVRRARLDECLRRRAGSSVLRHHRRGRQVRAEDAAAGHLHDRSVAREARRDAPRASRSGRRKPRKSCSRSRRRPERRQPCRGQPDGRPLHHSAPA